LRVVAQSPQAGNQAIPSPNTSIQRGESQVTAHRRERIPRGTLQRVREGAIPDANIRPPAPARCSLVRSSELEPHAAAVGEVLNPAGLAARAVEIATSQRSRKTRRTYSAARR
jgi:hypothetical protein